MNRDKQWTGVSAHSHGSANAATMLASFLGAPLLTFLAISIGTVAIPETASAAIFKCKDGSGNVSYSQTPCVGADETQKILANNTPKKQNIDCRIANNFARRTAMTMRAGQTSGDVFASYGGIDALPRTSIGVINYVYSHKDNTDTGVQRITALSAARCSGGSYGSVTCDDFPYNFIAELGGCEAAGMSNMAAFQTNAAQQAAKTDQTTNANTQSMAVKTTSTDSSAKENCKQDVQTQLTNLFAQMRAGNSASQQQKLQEDKQKLRTKLSGC